MIKLDIKILLTLAAIIAGLGGFYYTTQLRLDHLEDSVSECSGIQKQVVQLQKRIKRLENKVRN